MAEKIRYYIVVGSSRGLGAALVEEFLSKDGYSVIGISRTDSSKILSYDRWVSTGRYRHLELDIALPDCIKIISEVCSQLPKEPIGVIFNAAKVMSDITETFSIDFSTFKEINRIGIDGLGNTLNAFETHFLNYGGIFVGISSFSALVPPILEQRVAYPASKAYMDMALRCLRVVWNKRVRLVTVHLGHISKLEVHPLPRWLIPTYSEAAKKIVDSITGGKISKEVNYPFAYALVYRYLVPLFPDSIYYLLLGIFLKVIDFIKSKK